VNWLKLAAWLTASIACRSGEGTLPIQSTDVVWPAWIMIGPCTVRSAVSCSVAAPRTGIV
jgi:hypothetical protein